MLAWRVGVPYPVALVVAAVAVEETHFVALPRLEPTVVLFVFLPPLLFDAAFRLDVCELRLLARSILLLAVPGTFITAIVVGVVVSLVLGTPLAVGMLFGAVVAATDPVAVIGVFKSLRAPGRLAAIAEGESLVNDGMAIALHRPDRTGAHGGGGPATGRRRLWPGSSGRGSDRSNSRLPFFASDRSDRRPPDRDDLVDGARLR